MTHTEVYAVTVNLVQLARRVRGSDSWVAGYFEATLVRLISQMTPLQQELELELLVRATEGMVE